MLNRSRISFIAAVLVSLAGLAKAADYAGQFKQVREQKAPDAQVDSLLDEWRAKQPNDPDAWITSANYYFNQSGGTYFSTDPHDKGKYALTDQKTGKKAGTILSKPGVVQPSRSAADILQEATTKF